MKSKLILVFVFCFVVSMTFAGCYDTSNTNPVVTIVMDPDSKAGVGGTFAIELFPDVAPNTVRYFIELVSEGIYDNFYVSKVMAGALVQFGDPWYQKDIDTMIDGEFTENGFENNLKFERGIVGMSRYSDVNDSACGDFFIVLSETLEEFDGKYAAFGKVISGLDVVEKISYIKSSEVFGYEPLYSQATKKATVELKGITYPPAITNKRTVW